MIKRTQARCRSTVVVFALITVVGSAGVFIASGSRMARARSHSVTTGSRLACSAAALSIAIGRPMSEYTGEESLDIVVTNTGRKTCLLIGYPAVVIQAGKRALPFTYDDGGGAYLSTQAPTLLTLRPGSQAAFVVAKYRCDVGDLAAGTSMDIWLPGVPATKTMSLALGSFPLCRKFKPTGPPDPGNTITVSPLEKGKYAS